MQHERTRPTFDTLFADLRHYFVERFNLTKMQYV